MKNFIDTLKKNYIYGILILMVVAIVILGIFLYLSNLELILPLSIIPVIV